MLRISRRADYAVRVMIAVASAPEGEHTPTPQIGDEMTIPQSFLVKVVGDLRRSGLIDTVAGRSGGVLLAQPAETITLRHIIEAVEGPIVLNMCLLQPGECPRDQICPVHPVWAHIQDVLCREMDAVRLSALVEEGYSLRQSGSDSDPAGAKTGASA